MSAPLPIRVVHIRHFIGSSSTTMSNKSELELFFSSPNRYEKLTIEVQLDRQRIAEVNQDKGSDQLELELQGGGQVVKVPLDDFIDALVRARQLLLDRANPDESE